MRMETSMTAGIFFAGLNSLFQAIMVKFDQLMMSDCYGNRPRMAWLVSTVAGTFFGIIAMLIAWVVHGLATDNFVHLSDSIAIWRDGLWMTVVGILTTVVMGSYFHLFKATEAGDAPDVTTISMWLASTPIWVTLFTWIIVTSDVRFGPLEGLELGEVSAFFFASIVMTTFFIIWFDTEGKRVPITLKRGLMVMVMVSCISAYTIIASSVLYERDPGELIALQPYYWLGFASGLVILFSKKVRAEVREFAPKFRQYRNVILVAELFGAGVYIFEMYAFWHLSGVLVNLISSGHVILVFLLGYILTFIGKRMIRNNPDHAWNLGAVKLAGKSLISEPANLTQWALFSAVVLSLFTAIILYGA